MISYSLGLLEAKNQGSLIFERFGVEDMFFFFLRVVLVFFVAGRWRTSRNEGV